MRTHAGIEASSLRLGGLAALLGAVGVALLLWAVRPLPDGTGYALGIQVTVVLLVVWLAWCLRPAVVQGRAMMAAVLVAGVVATVASVLAVDPNAEVVRTYASLFDAIAHGRNPYTCDCIVHLTPYGARMGDFNYPPAEIWPYQLVHGLFRHWDSVVLTLTIVGLNLIAYGVLLAATPRHRRRYVLVFLPLLVPWVLDTTIGMTMLATAAVVALVLVDQRTPRPWRRHALRAVFGVGLLTKFAIIPIFATWWWWSAVRRARGEPRLGWRGAAADALVPAAIAFAVCLPFGPMSVVRNTVLFNAVLSEREKLTTFYPNVLSGLTRWAGAGRVYPVIACALLLAAILLAPRVTQMIAMLLSTTVFLLIAPTPEPQYLPVVILLFLAALIERERGATPAWTRPRRPEPEPGRPRIAPG